MPNALPSVRKPIISKPILMIGYVHPIGMAPPVAYWMIAHNPVSPPLASPVGMMIDVQAIQNMSEPTVIRK